MTLQESLYWMVWKLWTGTQASGPMVTGPSYHTGIWVQICRSHLGALRYHKLHCPGPLIVMAPPPCKFFSQQETYAPWHTFDNQQSSLLCSGGLLWNVFSHPTTSISTLTGPPLLRSLSNVAFRWSRWAVGSFLCFPLCIILFSWCLLAAVETTSAVNASKVFFHRQICNGVMQCCLTAALMFT